ncbi:hypothetical protein BDN67DRAFT_968583 [Paxillus ammoniavirescens]|nr:hypothetical protein BDN67DRAFT_968583 [Paxillus ammoniavirescens]
MTSRLLLGQRGFKPVAELSQFTLVYGEEHNKLTVPSEIWAHAICPVSLIPGMWYVVNRIRKFRCYSIFR